MNEVIRFSYKNGVLFDQHVRVAETATHYVIEEQNASGVPTGYSYEIAKPSLSERNRARMEKQAEEALVDFRVYRALTPPTNDQTVTVVKLLCRAVGYLIRLRLNKTEAID